MVDVTVDLSESALKVFDQKIEFLKNLKLDPWTKYMLMVGPENADVMMKHIEAFFLSGFYAGIEHERNKNV